MIYKSESFSEFLASVGKSSNGVLYSRDELVNQVEMYNRSEIIKMLCNIDNHIQRIRIDKKTDEIKSIHMFIHDLYDKYYKME